MYLCIRSRGSSQSRIDREIQRIGIHEHLRRTVLCSGCGCILQRIKDAVIGKERQAQLRQCIHPLVKVHAHLCACCQVETELHSARRTLDRILVNQGMVVHIGQTANQLFILDIRGQFATDSRLSHQTHAHFETGLPEDRQFLELHTEEERHLYISANQPVLQRIEEIIIGHLIAIRLHTVGEQVGAIVLINDTHDGVIEIELRTDGHQELFITHLITDT